MKRCTERDKIVFAADNDFDAFYQLHELTLNRKGAALYLPKSNFARFLSASGRSGFGAHIYSAIA